MTGRSRFVTAMMVAGFLFLWSTELDPRSARPWTIAQYLHYYGDRKEVRRRLAWSSLAGGGLVLLAAAAYLAPRARSLHGDARFAKRGEIAKAGLLGDEGIILGRLGARCLMLSGQQGVLMVGSYMRLGHLYALQKRTREAHDAVASEIVFLEKIDHALRSRIRIELHMRLGQSLLALGERERANAAFEIGLDAFAERLKLGADEPFTRYYAAAIHALRGENDEAIDLLGQPQGLHAERRVDLCGAVKRQGRRSAPAAHLYQRQ